MTVIPSYSVGTVSVKKGDTAIVGAGGPLWTSTANARAGDDIIVAGHIWPLSDVIDAAHLAIDPWPFDDVPTGSPYKILQRSPLRFAGGQAAADVTQLVGALNTEGLFRIVPAGATAPDPSLGEENQYALQPSTFKLWLKTGGQWVFQGIFKGFNIRGPYSATTAYLANDIISQDGSSYVALVDNTGQPVTNAAVWGLFAAKGDQGTQGPQGTPGTNGTNGVDGAGYAATSTASLTIGTGSKTFTAQTGLAYSAGARARASNGTNYMEGQVTAYGGGNLTISVDRANGSGTFASWKINLAGDPGANSASVASPQGRLTLTSGVAITTADVVGATNIFFTPVGGGVLPIWNGSSFIPTAFAELGLALDATTTDVGFHQIGRIFDVFVVNDSGVVRLGTGPAWSSDTARGAGAGTTELDFSKFGIPTNKNAIALRYGAATANTINVPANQATYVGSFRAVANGQATDSKSQRLLFNAYN